MNKFKGWIKIHLLSDIILFILGEHNDTISEGGRTELASSKIRPGTGDFDARSFTEEYMWALRNMQLKKAPLIDTQIGYLGIVEVTFLAEPR